MIHAYLISFISFFLYPCSLFLYIYKNISKLRISLFTIFVTKLYINSKDISKRFNKTLILWSISLYTIPLTFNKTHPSSLYVNNYIIYYILINYTYMLSVVYLLYYMRYLLFNNFTCFQNSFSCF